ncbi:MAG TPA: penicillin-binding transpeptidase domain-containing protein [Bacillales bacterium]|nr:penicillin-binding transpeptidase domain-containing protein [Bacillales bacterium]
MEPLKNRNINKGAALLSIVFLLLFFTLIARFGYIEATKRVEGEGLQQLAWDTWARSGELQAHRGTIFGTKGEPLAKNVPAFTVYAVLSEKHQPDYVKDPEMTAEKLAPILNMEKSRLMELLTKDAYRVELGPGGRRIGYDKKEKIAALELPGIGFIRQSRRFYPNGKFASYVLGFVTRDRETGKLVGEMGIEKTMNRKLQGEDGSFRYLSDPAGVRLPGTEEAADEPEDGNNVYLTIDSHIQMFLEYAVSKAYEAYDPKRIMAVVMNPDTGEILAMSNRPSFNPNTRQIDDYTNDIVSGRFEPGSVMKIFTLAAAVDAGVYDGDDTYLSGKYHVPGGTVTDWNGSGWGRITFNQGVQRSSNVAFAILAREKLGFDDFYEYLMAFDFKKRTGIALPDEANSVFQYDVPYEKTTTAFGQGTAVTVMQLIKASTAVANNGKMMKPYIVEKVVNPNTGEVVLKNEPKVEGTPISAETAKKVRNLLRTVVTGKHGTGREFAIDGYAVAGKTGTAQIVGPNGTYIEGKYIHSFLGMAPKDDPKLVMYVAVGRPDVKYSYQGSRPVADIFTFVMKHSLQYLNVGPEVTGESEKPTDFSVKLRNHKGETVEHAKEALESKGMKVVTIGSGKTVTAQIPHRGTTVLSGERVLLRTEGRAEMPDLSGWSLADVMKLAELLHLHPDIEGSGYVISQNVAPGTPVKAGGLLSVKLGVPEPRDKAEEKTES